MYDGFYGLTGMPFQLTPDSRFFFGSKGHSRAIAHLTYGLAQAEGFIVVTGEVGAGKTTLVERLWGQLDRGVYQVARVNTTQISGDDLLRLIAAGFGVTAPVGDKAALLLEFEAFLARERGAGRRALLVVDEVQNLPLGALEELRMLSNLTANGRASMQTILLGQPQFRRTLASADLDQLRQRVLASYHLGPIGEDETRLYVEHRLRAVGWAASPHFDADAFTEIYLRTDGIPRRINRLCSRVLLYGALEEARTITRAMVAHTAAELADDLEGAPVTAQADAPAGEYREELGAVKQRLSALEDRVARRERVFQRLMDVLGGGERP